ncbi:hypothetical protein AVEN_134500-2 [Araneus ventricosus]|uniref:CCHC-type domain-containing protein n=1 Tax=Araneus ventricosus TaxID=182803 RepID=A0A4Y2UEL8_ARAVE|nr:hypothetical protein AVEN_134500-2 [Araneus ventricosus]
MATNDDFVVQAQKVHEMGLDLLDTAAKSNNISQANQNNFKKIYMDFVDIINKQQKLLNIVTGRMLEQKDIIQSKLDKLTESTTSFAEVVKDERRIHRSRSRPRDKKNTVLIYSKDETDSNKVKDKVQNVINPSKLKIGIRNVKNIKKGILIECNNDEEIKRLTDEIERNEILKDTCEIRQPTKLNPKIIIYRVSEDMDVKEGLVKLKEQNLELEEAVLTHEYLQKTRNGTNWIISIDPKSFFKILKTGKINYGWQRHSVREYLKVKQCFKCYKFGHLAKVCRNITDDKVLCSKCGQEGHKYRECRNEAKCLNCTNSASKTFNCGFLNLNHARAASSCLETDVLKRNLDLMCLNEPYYYQGTISGCPKGYNQISFNRDPRTAIFIRNSIDCIRISVERDLIALSIDWNNMEYIIVCVYCSPSENLDNNIIKLETICTCNPNKRTIIFGDFNAKSSAWSPRSTDLRGRVVLEFINKMDIVIENSSDSLATYSCEKGESWIDLTLSKNIDRNLVNSWQVHSDITASDHRLITYSLCEGFSQVHKRIIWKTENMKLIDFKLEISKLVRNYSEKTVSRGNLDEILSSFCHELTLICKKCKVKKTSKKWKSAIWWTKSLEAERSRIRALRRRFQACTESAERVRRRIFFKKEFTKYKRSILDAKTNSFKRFLEKLVNKNNLGLVKNVIKFSNIELRIEKIKLASGDYLENYGECRDFIIKSHFPLVSMADDFVINYDDNGTYPEFTVNEVERCIGKMKRGKAPGEDGFSLEIIEEIFYADKDWFVEIFNYCLRFGYFPKIWKELF